MGDEKERTCPLDEGGYLYHVYRVDEGDRNFKICTFCGKTAYRTDEEIVKEHT